MSGEGRCFLCKLGVTETSKRNLLRKGSPTFNVLCNLLGARDDGVPSVLSSDAEILSMCDMCSGIVHDLSDLQELLESTQNAIRDKIRWIKETVRSKTVARTNAEINEEINVPETFSPGAILSTTRETHEDGPLLKTEPVDFEFNSAFLDDIMDDIIFEPGNLADTYSPKTRKRELDSEDETDEESKWDKKLLKFHGLDKQPQPRVSLQRVNKMKSHFSTKIGRSRRPRCRSRGRKLTVIVVGDNKNVTSEELSEPDECDEFETEKLRDQDDDPDFVPPVDSDTDAVIPRGRKKVYGRSKSPLPKKSVSERCKKKETETAERSLLSSVISVKKRRVRLNQDIAIVVNDGKMMLGTQEIVEEDDYLFCCYDTCTFKMKKAETEIESSNKMLDHFTVAHTGSGTSGQYGCRKCHLRFKNRSDHQKHFSHQHGSELQKRKLGQPSTSSQRRAECSDCGKPLLISGIYRHQWSHKSEEEKQQWLAEGRRNPTEPIQRAKEKNQNALAYQCSSCDKRFAYKASMKAHEEVHKDKSERRKFVCDQCGQIFVTENGLKLHRRRAHNPELNLGKWKFCPICPDVKYLIRTHLELHMMKHHGFEKKYVCEQCGYRSATKENLDRHMFVHLKEGERPFQCEYCSMDYKHKSNLARHIQLSHPDKYNSSAPVIKPVKLTCKQMYPCGTCDRPFELPSRMRKHQLNCKK